MRRIEQTAYAKINLSLDVLGRREDGYHIVRMIMQTIGISDDLIFETQDKDCSPMEIALATDSGEIPCGEDNLIVRAVRSMEKEFGLRGDLKITLTKRIPVAAGLAGGSTDAAAALRAVRDLFVPEVSDGQLQRIGATLGADIPYCITGGTQLSEGIGEILTVLPDAPACGLVICKPSAGVSTGEVYKRYDSLVAAGSMMGSGGMVVMDETSCMPAIAKFYLEFTCEESCGKCSPCRIGNKRLCEILEKITDGRGTMEDLEELRNLAAVIKDTALCGLGQTSPNPVLSTLDNFWDEYVEHVVDKKCRAGVCKKLMSYVIDREKCIGCGKCAKGCPVEAITRTDYIAPGHKLASMVIDSTKCIKCGACINNCKFGAISIK